jgi:polyhydroxybutyrate depolymerase
MNLLPITSLKTRLIFFGFLLIISMSFSITIAEVENSIKLASVVLEVDGVKREFDLFYPNTTVITKSTSIDRSKLISHGAPYPLLLAYHGYRGTPKGLAELSGWTELAKQYGFAVAYLKGRQAMWNAGAIRGNHDDNDIRFTDEVINYAKSHGNIDLKRIYATGMSNGGFFVMRLACTRPDVIAAAGAVAATMAQPVLDESCITQPRAVPVAFINGTDDPVVLWEGGLGKLRNRFPDSELASVPNTMTFWQTQHGCSADGKRSQTATPDDEVSVTHVTYDDCEQQYSTEMVSSPVQQWIINGGGHVWPGSPIRNRIKQRIYRWFVGETTNEFSATEVLWTFFKSQRL